MNLKTSIYTVLKNELLANPRYSSNDLDSSLLRNKVSEDALKMESTLIQILLGNPTLRSKFFTEVNGVLVFDKMEFNYVVSNKEFLPNSFTRFKQKIGLVDSKGEFIADKDDVVLSFPYKDCVLEGGQTKEDQKKDEVFYNVTLAPDEVDCLLAPKVFCNAKRYTKEGVTDITEFNDNDNLIIKGNNLLVLSSLLKRYEGKVKLIYIDPPYNTGNDSFGYNDSFNHSTWLTFMKNRLRLAKRLLREDGAICIQCDDREEAYLKVLCDETFGFSNFINIVTVKAKASSGASGGGEDKRLKKNTESILIYSRNRDHVIIDKPIEYIPIDQYIQEHKENKIGFYYTRILDSAGKKELITSIGEINVYKHRDFVFSTVNEKMKSEHLSLNEVYRKYFDKIFMVTNAQTSLLTKVNGVTPQLQMLISYEYVPKTGRDKNLLVTKFVWNKTLVVWFSDCAIKNSDGVFKQESIGTLWDDISWGRLDVQGNIHFKNGKKPEKLIQRIIEMTTNENDIVLDYFLGSGTTAAVAQKVNRKYIGVEQLDYVDSNPKQRLINVINGDQTGISKDVNWQGGGSFVYCELQELNYEILNQITHATTSEELDDLYETVRNSEFISTDVDPKILFSDNTKSDFKKLSVIEKKNLLIKLLDLNMLYVNYSDIDDQNYNISERDKQFTKSFYGD